ncbi:MAG: carboxynorspermidine decarboxylase [Elusimicrobiota bacterium]|nr:carboxynorspermidine decarboxylase [Elusimicrobiota bacterium]
MKTPYYLIDEKALLKNMKKIAFLRDNCGAKFLLALKCFSTWAVFDLMKKYMDGSTSSSLYEAKLGAEKFGKEVCSYSVAYSKEDIDSLKGFADKIIFNSISQLERFYKDVKEASLGLRVNPSISYSHFDLADPARKFCRLGERDIKKVKDILPKINGIMLHYNCENDDFKVFSRQLDFISKKYGSILKELDWVSLGGGIYFTKDNYPLEDFCKKIKEFKNKFDIEVYFEPGEAAITNSAHLITTVLDIVKNVKNIAVVDASIEAHCLDLLTYRISAKLDEKIAAQSNGYEYIIAGNSCLAGDIFGKFNLAKKLKIGDKIAFADTAGYTMVKKNWFNGVKMPSIAIKRLNGKIETVKTFDYEDFKNALS